MNRPDHAAHLSSGVDKRAVLIVAAMASFLTPFMGSSISVALPTISKEFSVDAVSLTWITTAYLLAAAMFLVPFGKIADIRGRKKVLLCGVAGYTVVSLLCGLANSENALIALRSLQGLTDAMMFGTSGAIVTSVFPPKERGRAMGLTVASVYLGLSLGPVIGGAITKYMGWRSIFYLTAVLGAFTVMVILSKIRGEWAEARGQKFDVVGSIFYGAMLLCIMYGFTLVPSLTGFLLIAIGILCMAAFALWESKATNPVLNVDLFRRNSVFALSSLSALINYSATFAIAFMMSLYLQFVKGFDSEAAGLIMLSQSVIMALFSPLAGRLSDRVEPRIVASAGMGLSTVGLALLSLMNDTTALPQIIATLLVVGLGFALFSSPNQNAIMSSVERQYYGVASAIVGAMRLIGQSFSMGIAALIVAVFLGDVQITPQYYPAFLEGFRLAFTIFAVLCLFGVFASLARGKIHSETPVSNPRVLPVDETSDCQTAQSSCCAIGSKEE